MTGDLERREHILAVAERLLRHYGPQKTTIAEIAKAADVGVGTVYLEFPSKEAIVEELSRVRHRGVLGVMQNAARSGGKFSQRVRAVFDARLRAFTRLAEEGAHARDLVHCMNPAVRAEQARFKEGEVALLVDLLRAGEAAGELIFPSGSPESTARALLQAYAVFAPPYVFGAKVAELEEEHEAMHRLVLIGLCARGAPGVKALPKKRRPKIEKGR